MGEDAAAAARRIVEEVLAGRATSSGQGADTPRTRSPEADDGTGRASALAAEDEDVEAGAPAPAVGRPPRRQDEPGGGPEVRSEAERIARQIVEEVLAAETEVRVRGVPRDGLPVDDERTAKIVVDPEPAGESTQRVPGGGASGSESVGPAGPGPGGSQGPDASSSGQRVPGPASTASSAETELGPDPDSAQDIVRRIVADVQAKAPATPPGDTDDDTSETVHLPATSAALDSPDSDSPGPEDSGASPGTVELPVGMTEQSGDPATAIAEEGTTRVVPRRGEKREAPSESASGPVALTDDADAGPGRPLVGWAPPPEPEPAPAAAAEEPAPRTLRWLLASLLGAVALAVLFPLAVAALRALVSLG